MTPKLARKKNKDAAGAGGARTSTNSKKPKMTKEERRAKYTALARQRSESKRRTQKNSHLICFGCRKRGHAVSECPEQQQQQQQQHGGNGDDGSSSRNAKRQRETAPPPPSSRRPAPSCCYRCGSAQHALANCPKPVLDDDDDEEGKSAGGRYGYLPFATCFVCGERGHLASDCKDNENGVYVHGGSCKWCGSRRHLAKSCPENRAKKKKRREDSDDGVGGSCNYDELLQRDGQQRGDEQPEIGVGDAVSGGSGREAAAEAGAAAPGGTSGEEITGKANSNKKRRRVVNF